MSADDCPLQERLVSSANMEVLVNNNKDLFVPKNKIFTFFELYEKKYLRRVPVIIIMANKIRQQKQVRLGSRIYKLLKKKKLAKNNKKTQKPIHSMFKRNLRKRGKQCVILSIKN